MFQQVGALQSPSPGLWFTQVVGRLARRHPFFQQVLFDLGVAVLGERVNGTLRLGQRLTTEWFKAAYGQLVLESSYNSNRTASDSRMVLWNMVQGQLAAQVFNKRNRTASDKRRV